MLLTLMLLPLKLGIAIACLTMLLLLLPVAPDDLCDRRPRAILVGKCMAPQRQSNNHCCMPIIHKPQGKEKMNIADILAGVSDWDYGQ